MTQARVNLKSLPKHLEVEELPELFGDDDFAVQDASRAAISRSEERRVGKEC